MIGELIGFMLVIIIFSPLYQYLPPYGLFVYIGVSSVLFILKVSTKDDKK